MEHKKKNDHKSRRQFLKNTSFAALATGIISTNSQASETKELKPEPQPVCDKTTLDFYGEGPFYTDNPPTIENTLLAQETEEGTRLIISGRIYNLDCNEYLPNVVVDIWQADHSGAYDNEGYNLRGKTLTNDQGFYIFETILPGKYPLNETKDRPAHIHFKITPPEFPTLITQLYFEGDPDIPADAAASITEGNFDASHRIIPLTENEDGKMEGTWDIILDGNGITNSLNTVHLDKGIIYQASPSPFTDNLLIKYGVFRQAKVSLLVYDIEGNLVATLEERMLTPEKYEAEWRAGNLPNGHYFIALKINDFQVHYLKVMKI